MGIGLWIQPKSLDHGIVESTEGHIAPIASGVAVNNPPKKQNVILPLHVDYGNSVREIVARLLKGDGLPYVQFKATKGVQFATKWRPRHQLLAFSDFDGGHITFLDYCLGFPNIGERVRDLRRSRVIHEEYSPDNKFWKMGSKEFLPSQINGSTEMNSLHYPNSYQTYSGYSEDDSKDRDNDFAALFARRVMQPVIFFLLGSVVTVVGVLLQFANYKISGLLCIASGVMGTLICGWLWALWII